MTEPIPGWVVERQIPQAVHAGLQSGIYRQDGGVIRWAVGTEHAGRIVRHLLPIGNQLSDSVTGAAGQRDPAAVESTIGRMAQLSSQYSRAVSLPESATDLVIKLAGGTMDLAGLNLAVTAMGFAVLHRKLDSIEGRLRELQADVKEIKNLLERKERARLRSALRDLLRIEAATDASDRRTILHNARQTLGEIHENYVELLPEAATVESALAYEEYFCVTAIARTRCTAELGMLGLARQELEDTIAFWKTQAVRIGRDLLLGDQPERFLEPEFADLPFARVAAWLDFTYGEEKGFEWIDDLRLRGKKKTDRMSRLPGKGSGWIDDIRSRSKQITERTGILSVGSRFFQTQLAPERIGFSLERMTSRSAIFDGYAAQYALLEEARLLPSEFEQRLRAIESEAVTSGFVFLKPGDRDKSAA